jgi:hypothetical protein
VELLGRLYLFGGVRFERDPETAPQLVCAAEVYCPDAHVWTRLPDMPDARQGASAVELGGRLYVVGGSRSPSSDLRSADRLSQRIDVFDPAVGSWLEPLSMPESQSAPSVWVVDDKLHLAGGTAVTGRLSTVTEVYQPANETWSEGRPLPIARADDAQATCVGGRWILFARDRSSGAWCTRALTPLAIAESPEEPEVIEDPVAAPARPSGSRIAFTDGDVKVNVDQLIEDATSVRAVAAVENNVTKETRETIRHDQLGGVLEVEIPYVPSRPNERGLFDHDTDFFLRVATGGTDLVHVVAAASGDRYLLGRADEEIAPAPPGCDRTLFLYDKRARQIVCFSTDERGQFTVALPPEVGDACLVFKVTDGVPSAAAVVDLT